MESSVFHLSDIYEDDTEIYLFTDPSELYSIERNNAGCERIWRPVVPQDIRECKATVKYKKDYLGSSKKPDHSKLKNQQLCERPIKIPLECSSGIYKKRVVFKLDVGHETEIESFKANSYKNAVHYFKNLKGKQRLLPDNYNACLLARFKNDYCTDLQVYVLVEALTYYKCIYDESGDRVLKLPLLANINKVLYPNRSKVTGVSRVKLIHLNSINMILSLVNVNDIITILKTLKVLRKLARDPIKNRFEDSDEIFTSLTRLIFESYHPEIVKLVSSILYRIVSHTPVKDLIISRKHIYLIHIIMKIISGELQMKSKTLMKCKNKITSLLAKMTANYDLKFCGFFLKFCDLFPLNSALQRKGLYYIKKKILIVLNNLLRHPEGYYAITHCPYFSFIPFLKCLWCTKRPGLRQAAFLVLDSILRISRATGSRFNHRDFIEEFGLEILIELLEDVANIDRKLSLQSLKLLGDLSDSHLGCQLISELGINIISSIAFYKNPQHLVKIIGRIRGCKRRARKKRVESKTKTTKEKIVRFAPFSKKKGGIASKSSKKAKNVLVKQLKTNIICLYDDLQLYNAYRIYRKPYLQPDILNRPIKSRKKRKNIVEWGHPLLIRQIKSPNPLQILENLIKLKEEKSNQFERMGYAKVLPGENINSLNIKWQTHKRDISNKNLSKTQRSRNEIVMEVSRLATSTPFNATDIDSFKEREGAVKKRKTRASSGSLCGAHSDIMSKDLDEEKQVVPTNFSRSAPYCKPFPRILPDTFFYRYLSKSGEPLRLIDLLKQRSPYLSKKQHNKPLLTVLKKPPSLKQKVFVGSKQNQKILNKSEYSLKGKGDHSFPRSILDELNKANHKEDNETDLKLLENIKYMESVQAIVNHLLTTLYKEPSHPKTSSRSLRQSETSSDFFIAKPPLILKNKHINKQELIEYLGFHKLPSPSAVAFQSSREVLDTRECEWRSSSSDELGERSDEYIYKHKLVKRATLEKPVKIKMTCEDTFKRRERRRQIRLDVKKLRRERGNSEPVRSLPIDHTVKCLVLPPKSDEFGNPIEYHSYPPQVFNSTRRAALMILCKIANDEGTANTIAGVIKMISPLTLVTSYAKTAGICLENIISQNWQAWEAVRHYDLLSYLVQATNRTVYPKQTKERLMGALTALLRRSTQQCLNIRTRDIRINIISWLDLVDPYCYENYGCVYNLRNICCIARVHPSRDYITSRQTITSLLNIMMDWTLRESYRIHACVAFSCMLFARKKFRKVKFYDKNRRFYKNVEIDSTIVEKTSIIKEDTIQELVTLKPKTKKANVSRSDKKIKSKSVAKATKIPSKTPEVILPKKKLSQKKSFIETLQRSIDTDLLYPSINSEDHSSYQLFVLCTMLLFMRRYPYQACKFLSRNYDAWTWWIADYAADCPFWTRFYDGLTKTIPSYEFYCNDSLKTRVNTKYDLFISMYEGDGPFFENLYLRSRRKKRHQDMYKICLKKTYHPISRPIKSLFRRFYDDEKKSLIIPKFYPSVLPFSNFGGTNFAHMNSHILGPISSRVSHNYNQEISHFEKRKTHNTSELGSNEKFFPKKEMKSILTLQTRRTSLDPNEIFNSTLYNSFILYFELMQCYTTMGISFLKQAQLYEIHYSTDFSDSYSCAVPLSLDVDKERIPEETSFYGYPLRYLDLNATNLNIVNKHLSRHSRRFETGNKLILNTFTHFTHPKILQVKNRFITKRYGEPIAVYQNNIFNKFLSKLRNGKVNNSDIPDYFNGQYNGNYLRSEEWITEKRWINKHGPLYCNFFHLLNNGCSSDNIEKYLKHCNAFGGVSNDQVVFASFTNMTKYFEDQDDQVGYEDLNLGEEHFKLRESCYHSGKLLTKRMLQTFVNLMKNCSRTKRWLLRSFIPKLYNFSLTLLKLITIVGYEHEEYRVTDEDVIFDYETSSDFSSSSEYSSPTSSKEEPDEHGLASPPPRPRPPPASFAYFTSPPTTLPFPPTTTSPSPRPSHFPSFAYSYPSTPPPLPPLPLLPPPPPLSLPLYLLAQKFYSRHSRTISPFPLKRINHPTDSLAPLHSLPLSFSPSPSSSPIHPPSPPPPPPSPAALFTYLLSFPPNRPPHPPPRPAAATSFTYSLSYPPIRPIPPPPPPAAAASFTYSLSYPPIRPIPPPPPPPPPPAPAASFNYSLSYPPIRPIPPPPPPPPPPAAAASFNYSLSYPPIRPIPPPPPPPPPPAAAASFNYSLSYPPIRPIPPPPPPPPPPAAAASFTYSLSYPPIRPIPPPPPPPPPPTAAASFNYSLSYPPIRPIPPPPPPPPPPAAAASFNYSLSYPPIRPIPPPPPPPPPPAAAASFNYSLSYPPIRPIPPPPPPPPPPAAAASFTYSLSYPPIRPIPPPPPPATAASFTYSLSYPPIRPIPPPPPPPPPPALAASFTYSLTSPPNRPRPPPPPPPPGAASFSYSLTSPPNRPRPPPPPPPPGAASFTYSLTSPHPTPISPSPPTDSFASFLPIPPPLFPFLSPSAFPSLSSSSYPSPSPYPSSSIPTWENYYNYTELSSFGNEFVNIWESSFPYFQFANLFKNHSSIEVNIRNANGNLDSDSQTVSVSSSLSSSSSSLSSSSLSSPSSLLSPPLSSSAVATPEESVLISLSHIIPGKGKKFKKYISLLQPSPRKSGTLLEIAAEKMKQEVDISKNVKSDNGIHQLNAPSPRSSKSSSPSHYFNSEKNLIEQDSITWHPSLNISNNTSVHRVSHNAFVNERKSSLPDFQSTNLLKNRLPIEANIKNPNGNFASNFQAILESSSLSETTEEPLISLSHIIPGQDKKFKKYSSLLQPLPRKSSEIAVKDTTLINSNTLSLNSEKPFITQDSTVSHLSQNKSYDSSSVTMEHQSSHNISTQSSQELISSSSSHGDRESSSLRTSRTSSFEKKILGRGLTTSCVDDSPFICFVKSIFLNEIFNEYKKINYIHNRLIVGNSLHLNVSSSDSSSIEEMDEGSILSTESNSLSSIETQWECNKPVYSDESIISSEMINNSMEYLDSASEISLDLTRLDIFDEYSSHILSDSDDDQYGEEYSDSDESSDSSGISDEVSWSELSDVFDESASLEGSDFSSDSSDSNNTLTNEFDPVDTQAIYITNDELTLIRIGIFNIFETLRNHILDLFCMPLEKLLINIGDLKLPTLTEYLLKTNTESTKILNIRNANLSGGLNTWKKIIYIDPQDSVLNIHQAHKVGSPVEPEGGKKNKKLRSTLLDFITEFENMNTSHVQKIIPEPTYCLLTQKEIYLFNDIIHTYEFDNTLLNPHYINRYFYEAKREKKREISQIPFKKPRTLRTTKKIKNHEYKQNFNSFIMKIANTFVDILYSSTTCAEFYHTFLNHLAVTICNHLEGPYGYVSSHTMYWHRKAIKKYNPVSVISIGELRAGSHLERASLFKYLADYFMIPCNIFRVGNHNTWNEVPVHPHHYGEEDIIFIDLYEELEYKPPKNNKNTRTIFGYQSPNIEISIDNCDIIRNVELWLENFEPSQNYYKLCKKKNKKYNENDVFQPNNNYKKVTDKVEHWIEEHRGLLNGECTLDNMEKEKEYVCREIISNTEKETSEESYNEDNVTSKISSNKTSELDCIVLHGLNKLVNNNSDNSLTTTDNSIDKVSTEESIGKYDRDIIEDIMRYQIFSSESITQCLEFQLEEILEMLESSENLMNCSDSDFSDITCTSKCSIDVTTVNESFDMGSSSSESSSGKRSIPFARLKRHTFGSIQQKPHDSSSNRKTEFTDGFVDRKVNFWLIAKCFHTWCYADQCEVTKVSEQTAIGTVWFNDKSTSDINSDCTSYQETLIYDWIEENSILSVSEREIKSEKPNYICSKNIPLLHEFCNEPLPEEDNLIIVVRPIEHNHIRSPKTKREKFTETDIIEDESDSESSYSKWIPTNPEEGKVKYNNLLEVVAVNSQLFFLRKKENNKKSTSKNNGDERESNTTLMNQEVRISQTDEDKSYSESESDDSTVNDATRLEINTEERDIDPQKYTPEKFIGVIVVKTAGCVGWDDKSVQTSHKDIENELIEDGSVESLVTRTLKRQFNELKKDTISSNEPKVRFKVDKNKPLNDTTLTDVPSWEEIPEKIIKLMNISEFSKSQLLNLLQQNKPKIYECQSTQFEKSSIRLFVKDELHLNLSEICHLMEHELEHCCYAPRYAYKATSIVHHDHSMELDRVETDPYTESKISIQGKAPAIKTFRNIKTNKDKNKKCFKKVRFQKTSAFDEFNLEATPHPVILKIHIKNIPPPQKVSKYPVPEEDTKEETSLGANETDQSFIDIEKNKKMVHQIFHCPKQNLEVLFSKVTTHYNKYCNSMPQWLDI